CRRNSGLSSKRYIVPLSKQSLPLSPARRTIVLFVRWPHSPISRLMRSSDHGSPLRTTSTKPISRKALRRFLPLVRFDEELYLRLYPDVKQAIDTGALTSARDHFVVHGYFEGRVFQTDPVYLDFTPEKGG